MFAERRPMIWPLYSAVQVIIGVNLLVVPASYRADSYSEHVRIATLSQWGWAFVTVGTLALGARFAPAWPGLRHIELAAARLVVSLGSALFVLWAAAFIPKAMAGTISINAPVMWTAAAIANAMSVWVVGTGRTAK